MTWFEHITGSCHRSLVVEMVEKIGGAGAD